MDRRLLFYNLLLLFFVSTIPFTTSTPAQFPPNGQVGTKVHTRKRDGGDTITTMPDYAVRAAFDEVLSEEVDERLLALVPGTVVSHPLNGGTEVAVPTTARTVLQVTDDLPRVATHLWGIAGLEPVALSIEPLED